MIARPDTGPISRRLALQALVVCGAMAPAATQALSADQSPRWFVGETIVCVNNRFLDLSDAPELVEGQVYTIKDILPARRGHLGIVVEEVRAKSRYLAFDERRFELVATFAAARGSAFWRRAAGTRHFAPVG